MVYTRRRASYSVSFSPLSPRVGYFHTARRSAIDFISSLLFGPFASRRWVHDGKSLNIKFYAWAKKIHPYCFVNNWTVLHSLRHLIKLHPRTNQNRIDLNLTHSGKLWFHKRFMDTVDDCRHQDKFCRASTKLLLSIDFQFEERR